MMFYKAYIEPWLFPPGLNILLIFFGLASKRFLPRLGSICLTLGFISLWLLSTPWFAYKLIDTLQTQYPLLTRTRVLTQNAAIVALGGGEVTELEYQNQHRVSDETLHRLNYSAYLAKNLKLPIIVSGGKIPQTQLTEADLMADYLNKNYKLVNIIKENLGNTTAQEANYIKAIAERQQLQTIYLVTHAWHMPRSMYAFRCMNVKVIPAPMGYIQYTPGMALISLLPNKEAMAASATALHEWVGLFWYHLNKQNRC